MKAETLHLTPDRVGRTPACRSDDLELGRLLEIRPAVFKRRQGRSSRRPPPLVAHSQNLVSRNRLRPRRRGSDFSNRRSDITSALERNKLCNRVNASLDTQEAWSDRRIFASSTSKVIVTSFGFPLPSCVNATRAEACQALLVKRIAKAARNATCAEIQFAPTRRSHRYSPAALVRLILNRSRLR